MNLVSCNQYLRFCDISTVIVLFYLEQLTCLSYDIFPKEHPKSPDLLRTSDPAFQRANDEVFNTLGSSEKLLIVNIFLINVVPRFKGKGKNVCVFIVT